MTKAPERSDRPWSPRIDTYRLAIGELLGPVPPTPARIGRFLKERGFPIVEGPSCTFVYRGEAREVSLRHWTVGLVTDAAFERIPGTDLWYYVLDLPEGSRIEYKLEVTTRRGTNLIEDPLNPLLAHDPFGANSVVHAHGYEVPDWTQVDPRVPAGSLEQRKLLSTALGGRRRLTLYKPPNLEGAGRCPLLLVHDGGDYLQYAGLKAVLDNLIHRREIPALVAALMHPPERTLQYRDSEGHAAYVAEELVPSLERELALTGGPAGRGLMGASLGAVASLSTAIRYPGFFGGLLLQSGSFAYGESPDPEPGSVWAPVAEMVNSFRKKPTAVSERVFVSCGLYESLIHENRALVPVLERTGMSVRYVESRDGHNWESWRDRLREGLSFLFSGARPVASDGPRPDGRGGGDG